jgi:hypothetical protein
MYFVEIDIRVGSTTITESLHDPHSTDRVLHKGDITLLLNAVNDFKFAILYKHPLFNAEIRPYSSKVRVKDDKNNIVFRGRIIDYTVEMTSSGIPVKEFVAECELAFLLDSVQRVREFSGPTIISTGEFVRILIRRHNDRVEDEKKIHMVNVNGEDYDPDLDEVNPFPLPLCDTCTACQTCGGCDNCIGNEYEEKCEDCASLIEDRYHIIYESTLKNITDNLLNEFGGYVWLDYRTSDDGSTEQRVLFYEQREEEFWKNVGSMPIKLAENLESIKSEQLSSHTLTRLVPLGMELNTPENAIKRLVAVGIIDNTDGCDTRDYGENVQWWLNNFGSIDPWMFQLLINLSRLNYIPCDGVDCDHEGCRSELTFYPLFDDWNDRFTDVNNIRNSNEFARVISVLHEVEAINDPDYWLQRGRANTLPQYLTSGLEADESIHLLRLRWLVRKAERALNTCRPRFQGSQEINARVNLGHPNWIEVDIEPALNRLEAAGILLPGGYWHRQFENRFRTTLSTWTGQLLLSLSVLNYIPEKVIAARQDILGSPAIDDLIANRLDEWFAGIDRLAEAGAIHNPEHWKERYGSRDTVALLWMTGQSVDTVNPHSQYANSARNLFGTIVEKVETWDNIACCDELWRKGIAWINNRALSNSISISALDLSQIDVSYDRFKVGNTYRAENELLKINEEYHLIRKTIDVVNPIKNSLTFGDRQIALSRISSRAR